MIDKSGKDKFWIYSALIFNLVLYSYATTLGVNCVFDHSQSEIHVIEIIDKDIRKGKRNRKRYYIKVEAWGNIEKEESIQVSKSKYLMHEVGDSIRMSRREGLLGIPWYYLK